MAFNCTKELEVVDRVAAFKLDTAARLKQSSIKSKQESQTWMWHRSIFSFAASGNQHESHCSANLAKAKVSRFICWILTTSSMQALSRMKAQGHLVAKKKTPPWDNKVQSVRRFTWKDPQHASCTSCSCGFFHHMKFQGGHQPKGKREYL